MPKHLVKSRRLETYGTHQVLSMLRKKDSLKLREEKKNPNHRANHYHNAEHAREVLQRVRELLPLLKAHYKKEGRIFPVDDLPALYLAAVFHDWASAEKKRQLQGLEQEEYSAKTADAFAKKKGFSLRQRQVLRDLILGTMYQNKKIQRVTDFQKLVAAADVGDISRSWEGWVGRSCKLLQEMQPKDRPKTLAVWLKSQQKFLQWARSLLTPEAKKKWGRRLKEKERKIVGLLQKQTGKEMAAIKKHILPLLLTRE